MQDPSYKYRIMYTQIREDKSYRWKMLKTFDSIYDAVVHLGTKVPEIAFENIIELTIEEDK